MKKGIVCTVVCLLVGFGLLFLVGCAPEPDEETLKFDIHAGGQVLGYWVSNLSQIKTIRIISKQKNKNLLEYKADVTITDEHGRIHSDNCTFIYRKVDGKWKRIQ